MKLSLNLIILSLNFSLPIMDLKQATILQISVFSFEKLLWKRLFFYFVKIKLEKQNLSSLDKD